MASSRPLIRIREGGDARDARVGNGFMVGRSGRELEDVARPPLDYSRGRSSFNPYGGGIITPRVYVTAEKPAPEPAPAIGIRVGLTPFGPPLPAAETGEPEPLLSVYPVADLVRALCRVCECTRADVTGRARTAHVVKARHIGFWILSRFTGRSLPAIGQVFDGRDHTTALWGIRRANHTITQLGIEVSDDPVEMMRRLYAATWPPLTQQQAPLVLRRLA